MSSQIQPVLMIPLRRCGSHALRLRLNFNPDFYSPYPLHIVDFMPLLPLYGDLQNDARYFQLVIDLLGLQAFSLVPWKGACFEPMQFFERLKNKPRSIHTVAWEMLFLAGETHHARVVLDKSLDNIHYWRDLIRLFPKMLFLNVVRDPRAQVSSMNRAIIHEFDSLLNAQIWVKAHEAAQELIQTHPEQVLTIRFEDFITEEEKTLKKVCSFLGMEFLPSMLEISRSEEAKGISAQSALWEFNSSKPIPEHVDKFKKTLSTTDIGRIESVTGKFMDHYGYARMTDGGDSITEEISREASQRSDAQRRVAWENLRHSKPQDFILRKRRAHYIEMCRQNLLG